MAYLKFLDVFCLCRAHATICVSVNSVILMQNHGLLKIFGRVLSLSRARNHLCVSVRYTVFLLDLPYHTCISFVQKKISEM